MSEERIVVSAAGIITALGTGAAAQWDALCSNRTGLRYPHFLQTKHAGDFLLGEVRQSNRELAAAAGIDLARGGVTRTALLAMAAMQDLLQQAGASLLNGDSLAFINANTVGGMSEVEHLYPRFIDPDDDGAANGYIDTLDCAESTENVAAHFGLKPMMATISTACSSSANALLLGARMIKGGLADRAICGGCDALSRYTLNGFHALKNVDKQPCRPFDDTRFGLNLGEGAAYLLLEKESIAKARGASILAVLSGYDNTNDAYHPTAPAPDGSGALRTMQRALDKAGLTPADIGYINAHGTATINNDAAEGKAIQQLWNAAPPPFSSTKPFTGHTLAAAGAVEAIFSILAIQQGRALPNLNFSVPMSDLLIRPVTTLEPANIRHTLSNSFGFGGSNTSLIFSKA